MTYGEAHTFVKDFIYMEAGKFKTISLPLHKPRMSKEDAAIYYSEKCRKTFLDLGFKYEAADDFEKRFEVAFVKVRAATDRMIKREVIKIKRINCEFIL